MGETEDNIKDNIKLKMYDTFINRIEKERELFWKFLSVYITVMIGINGVFGYIIKNNTNDPKILLILSFINIILSIIGIVIIIESNKWFFRNMMIVSNIENRILEEEHSLYIPKSFTKPENFNKVLDTTSSIFVSLFFTIFIFSIFLLDIGLTNLNGESVEYGIIGAICGFFIIIWTLTFLLCLQDYILFLMITVMISPILLIYQFSINIFSEIFLINLDIMLCGIIICGLCYINAKNKIENAMKELTRNPQNPE